jgi:LacI family transcriptional regulator
MLLNKHGIQFEKERVFVCEVADENNGFLGAKKAFESGIKFDGLFAITDYLAIGAIQFFKSKKIRIPEDILVVGFGNWKVTKFTSPSISTVDQSAFLMGENIFKTFLEEKLLKTQGDPPGNKILKLPTKLIVRESSKISSN